MKENPPLIPFSKNKYRSASEISSSSTSAIQSIVSQLKAGNTKHFNLKLAHSNIDSVITHNFKLLFLYFTNTSASNKTTHFK